MKLDIIIPVYNKPHLLRDLVQSILLGGDLESIGTIFIADDSSDTTTLNFISSLIHAAPVSIRHIRNKTNLGFLKNINNCFQYVTSELCVLINTDTLTPENWIKRAIAPFQQSSIALATPLSNNAANLTIRIPSGMDWRSFDSFIGNSIPTYPDACTAVGFFLVIRTEAIRGPIFDDSFGAGYGEETDLHYRLINEGWRSVIINNLYIPHLGGMSFSQVKNLDKIKQHNTKLFFDRWGTKHTKAMAAYKKKSPLKNIQTKTYDSQLDFSGISLDVLFILPALEPRVGGIEVVIEIVESLILSQVRANILVTGKIDKQYTSERIKVFNYFELTDLNKIFSVKAIYATHFSTAPITHMLSKKHQADFNYFIQGPEALFFAGKLSSAIINEYLPAKKFVTVSFFLKSYLELLNIPISNISLLPWGPDHLQFYAPDCREAHKKRIAVCIRSNPEKGTGLALYLCHLLEKRGFSIICFGEDSLTFDLPSTFKIFGSLDKRQVSELFGSVDFYIDASNFEGLGLLAMEAARCGAIPLITRNGGNSDFFIDDINCITFSISDIPQFIARISTLTAQKENDLRTKAVQLNNKLHTTPELVRNIFYPDEGQQTAPFINSKKCSLKKLSLVRKLSNIIARTKYFYRAKGFKKTLIKIFS